MSKINKAAGNMYTGWCTHTWEPFRPHHCAHECIYCYAKKMHHRFGIKEDENPHLDVMPENMGKDRTIFVGHMCDMWAENVSIDKIQYILDWCFSFENKYIFQSKNPERFRHFYFDNERVILGTTIETNRIFNRGECFSEAPSPVFRSQGIKNMKKVRGIETFITIEPIMAFDIIPFVKLIVNAEPDFVNIGADSKGGNLEEPTKNQVIDLIEAIQENGIKIKLKPNLKRILGEIS